VHCAIVWVLLSKTDRASWAEEAFADLDAVGEIGQGSWWIGVDPRLCLSSGIVKMSATKGKRIRKRKISVGRIIRIEPNALAA
jgi:hypothetical protein